MPGIVPAERMMIEVTLPIEQAVRAVPGVRNLRSTTSRGSAEVSINFAWGEDMVAALLQIESAINQVMPNLPSRHHLECSPDGSDGVSRARLQLDL